MVMVIIIIVLTWIKNIVWICDLKFLALIFASALLRTFSVRTSYSGASAARQHPQEHHSFLDLVLSRSALQGPLCFSESARDARLPRDRRQATASTHTPDGPGGVNMAAQGAPSSSPSDDSTASGSLAELPPTATATSRSPPESKGSSRSSLLQWTCPEDSLPLAVFYGPLDAKNPLLASCEKEIRELLGFMRKKKALATTEEEKHEFRRRW